MMWQRGRSVWQRRWSAASIALALALALVLSACSGGTTRPAGQGGQSGGQSAPAPSGGGQAAKVTIEYWQYTFDTKVKLVDELIREFQQQNPGIEVKHVHFPYENYNEKVAASVPAGRGPDVINLYYGWLPKYVDAGYLQPLPKDTFPAAQIEKDFYPLVSAAKMDGEYWALPTAVRTLALMWNKDLFKAAGLDPEKPPATWAELVDMAKRLTKRDAAGKLVQEGFAWNTGGQGHNWFREALIRQAGGQPLSDDRKKVQWTSPAGKEAFQFWLDLTTVHKVGEAGFMTDDITAFKTGKAAITVDGSFRLGALKKDAPNLDFGTAVLPRHKAQATMGSFWAHGVTKNATGAKKDAAVKFLQFLTSPAVQKRWTPAIGELPARAEVAKEFLSDPKMKGFLEGLAHAQATFFVDESADRAAVIEAAEKVYLKGVKPEQAVAEAEQKVQALYDNYWQKRK